MSREGFLQRYHGEMWSISSDITDAVEVLDKARRQADGPGLERAVSRLAIEGERQARRAFESKRDPRTGRTWASPAESTVADPRYQDLLKRTGALQSALTGIHRMGPSIGTARLAMLAPSEVVRRGMVHLYGVKRRKRGKVREAGTTPARRFVGFESGSIREIIDQLKRDMGFE